MDSFRYNPPKELDKKYSENEGEFCPYCESDNVTTYEVVEAAKIRRCMLCGEEWLECYQIVGILLKKEWPHTKGEN